MTGLLLINLGTPSAPTTSAVRRYLRQFLSDRRVIDINPIGRFMLLEGVILPTRPPKSAEAYRKIWTERGSPLLFHSQDLTDAVRTRLGDDWSVELGMRYGEPSIASALERLLAARPERIVVVPLYPQYASSSTGSSLEEVFRVAAPLEVVPPITAIGAFHAEPGFLEAFTAVGAPVVERERADHVLFSFHGLPERQIRKADPTGAHCLQSETCCDALGAVNRDCYRAQSYATARALATRLSLDPARWSVSFQSRLGRTPWIKPYTDIVLPELARAGKKRLVVFCPAFVSDCLETLEEIGIRAREQWLGLGGESLALVPSLNATGPWVETIADLARRAAGGKQS